jgi:hypothetical protein
MAVSIPVLRVLLKEFLDSKRETDERTEQRSIQTYRTDTTSENAQAPSFAFLKEEEGMTSASASEREVVDWRTGSHDALP